MEYFIIEFYAGGTRDLEVTKVAFDTEASDVGLLQAVDYTQSLAGSRYYKITQVSETVYTNFRHSTNY